MKKWKFLVATALVCGALTTVTSCIDNDEPAGIEQVRGAYAELYKANAAVQQAEAQIKLAQAETEKQRAALQEQLAKQQELLNEGIKLQNELQAAQNEEQKAQIEARLADLKRAQEQADLNHQATMLNLQTALAAANQAYLTAMAQLEAAKITAANDVYEAQIEQLVADLSEIQEDITDENIAILQAEADIYDLKTKPGTTTERILTADVTSKKIAYKKDSLTLLYAQQDLEFLKATNEKPVSEWEDAKRDIQDQIDSIAVVASNLKIEKEKKSAELDPLNEKSTKIGQKKLVEGTITFDVPAELQNDFYNYFVTYIPNDVDKNFERDLLTGDMKLKGSFVSNKLSLEDRTDYMTSLVLDIQHFYLEQFESVTGYKYNEQGKAAAQQKLKNLKDQLEVKKAKFEADTAVWKSAMTAYDTAFKAYKYGDLYGETANAITAYQDKVNVTPALSATEEKAAGEALIATLKAYYEKRKAFDGVEPTNPADGKTWAETIAATDAVDQIKANVNANSTSMLGSQNLNNGGAIADFIEASQAAFGTGSFTGNMAEPVGDASLAVPAEDRVYSGSYYTYVSVKKQISIIENIDKWVAFASDLKGIQAALQTEIDAIDAELEAVEVEKKPIEEALRNLTAQYNYFNTTRKNTLNKIKAALELAIQTGKDLASDILDLEEAVLKAEKDLAVDELALQNAEHVLDLFKEGKTDAQVLVAQSIKRFEDEIARRQDQIAELQRQFTYYTAQKDALLALIVSGNPSTEE